MEPFFPWRRMGLVTALLMGLRASAEAQEAPGARAKDLTWTQRQFLITFWCPPPATDETLAAVAREHFNLTWVPVEGLDVAARHGLRAMLTHELLVPATLDDPDRRARLDQLIDRVRTHPALECYFITDEPGAAAFPALGKLVEHLRARDPSHFAYINLFPTYATEAQLGVSADAAERARVGIPTNFAGVDASNKTVLAYQDHLKKYVETVKPALISYDHYHFLKKGDGDQYFLNLALIRMRALESKTPFLNIVQASTLEKVWRLPTASEMRFLVYTTLAYGARGISYFTYWGPTSYGGLYQDGKPSPLLGDVAALNGEIEKLAPALLELESMAVHHTAPLPYGTEASPADAPVRVVGGGAFVIGLFSRKGQASAFLVVNRSHKEEATAEVKVSIAGPGLEELDRATGRWSPGPDLGPERTVKIQLRPGDGRLLRARP